MGSAHAPSADKQVAYIATVAMEKELGNMQAKAQGSYQELQTMQIKVRALVIYKSANIIFLCQISLSIQS